MLGTGSGQVRYETDRIELASMLPRSQGRVPNHDFNLEVPIVNG